MVSSLAIAAILGGALGSLAFVVTAIFLVWFFLCRPRNVTHPSTIQLRHATLRGGRPFREFLRTSDAAPSDPPVGVELATRGRAESSSQGAESLSQGAESSSQLQNVTQRDSRPDQNVSTISEAVPSKPPIRVQTRDRAESSSRGASISSQPARIFRIEELYMATGDFSQNNFIGEGKFGRVYRGLLQNGTRIAIKKRPGARTREFAERARYFSSIRHQNLVTLLGCCQGRNLQFLVFELVPNGSVSSHLFCDDDPLSHQMLDFKQRLSIAIGAAKGLAHLHYRSPRLLHRDFKTANVLVDESFKVNVADAGIRLFLERDDLGGLSSQVAADEIFLAPEVIEHSHYSVETDVYSFGVFLLELVSGHHATDSPYPDSSLNLVEWVRTNEESDEIADIADEKLGRSFTVEGIKGCITLAVQCVERANSMRPEMSNVVKELEDILQHEIRMAISEGSPVFIRGGKPVSTHTMNEPVIPHSM